MKSIITKIRTYTQTVLTIAVVSVCLGTTTTAYAQYEGGYDWGYDSGSYDYGGYDSGSYDYGSYDYGGYDTYYDTSWNNYDYSDYGGVGDSGYGCCDDWYDYSSYSDSYAYDDYYDYSWDNFDYSDYGGVGDEGYGCCDDYYNYSDYTNENYYTYDYQDYGSYSTPYYSTYSTPYYYSSPGYGYVSYDTYYDYDYTYAQPPRPEPRPICDSFTASDTRVEEGDPVTLEWRTTNADDVDIDHGIGDVPEDGSESVRITRDTTFELSARNGSDEDICRVSVRVDEEDRDIAAPRCEFTISDRNVSAGESIRLSWDNDRTDRLTLRDNHGNTLADSEDDNDVDPDRDSITTRPTRDTEYTLTVFNDDNERRTCEVSVDVEGLSVAAVRTQDTIALAGVPYTGFEAGPVLTFIFYSALALWGAVVGYFLVLKKKAVAIAGHGVATSVARPAIATIAHAPISEITETDTIEAIPFNLPTEETEYAEHEGEVDEDALRTLETYAHDQYALLSSDALRFIASQNGTLEEQTTTLANVITRAKERFPKEGDWMVLNKERVVSLLN